MGENMLVQTFTDITDSVRYQEQLQDAAQFLQQVIDGSHTGILVVSPVYDEQREVVDFRFKSLNKTVASLVNQEPEALMGDLHSRWFPEYQRNGAFESYKQAFISGGDLHFENHFENEENDRWMDVVASKIGDDVLISFHEFTTLKKLQLKLEATVEELKASNERLSQFTHVASHDLKEPLRKITMYTSMMDRESNTLTQQQTEFLQRIKGTAARMQSLINDLLTFAQVNTRPHSLEPIALEDIIRTVLTDLEAGIAESSAVVQIDALPTIRGEEGQLGQLFQNLISNALKFHKVGQAPEIRIQATTLQRSELPSEIAHFSPASRYYRISVKDNGIGFDPKYKEKIFQIFQRLHNRDEYDGTGIGLAIVSKIMENHQGYILADSRMGEGASFNLFFPA
jgi:signal transduction histidine kinase